MVIGRRLAILIYILFAFVFILIEEIFVATDEYRCQKKIMHLKTNEKSLSIGQFSFNLPTVSVKTDLKFEELTGTNDCRPSFHRSFS